MSINFYDHAALIDGWWTLTVDCRGDERCKHVLVQVQIRGTLRLSRSDEERSAISYTSSCRKDRWMGCYPRDPKWHLLVSTFFDLRLNRVSYPLPLIFKQYQNYNDGWSVRRKSSWHGRRKSRRPYSGLYHSLFHPLFLFWNYTNRLSCGPWIFLSSWTSNGSLLQPKLA